MLRQIRKIYHRHDIRDLSFNLMEILKKLHDVFYWSTETKIRPNNFGIGSQVDQIKIIYQDPAVSEIKHNIMLWMICWRWNASSLHHTYMYLSLKFQKCKFQIFVNFSSQCRPMTQLVFEVCALLKVNMTTIKASPFSDTTHLTLWVYPISELIFCSGSANTSNALDISSLQLQLTFEGTPKIFLIPLV